MMSILIFLPATILFLLSAWVLKQSKQHRLNERMMEHFSAALPNVSAKSTGANQNFIQKLKVRVSIYAGFELQKKHLISIPTVLLLIVFLGWHAYGLFGAMLTFSLTVFFFGFLLPYNRLQRRKTQTISQVPLFIDQVLRTLSTGRSLENAIRFASSEASPPLRDVMDRVTRATDLGADLVESLTEVASLHQLRELNLIALAVRISNNYGSSPHEMLDSVVKMVRMQEQARRELSAMTGETRISAWVLGMTPIAIAAYIMMMNPNYLNMLLQDATGQTIMATALILQCLGALILWRMLRSV